MTRSPLAPTEADVQRTITDTLRWQGWQVIRLNSGAMVGEATESANRRFVRFTDTGNDDESICDLMAVSPTGRVVWIEVKRPGWKPPAAPENPLRPSADYRRYSRQARFLAGMRKRGHAALFATCLEDVLAVVGQVKR